MSYNYHLITNIGTALAGSETDFVRSYPNTLILHQLCVASKDYREEFKRKIRAGHRVLLDNGAHEGIDVDIKEYAAMVEEMQPTVAVLTDLVGRPHDESFRNSLRLLDYLDRSKTRRTKFMFVPQGTCKADVLDGYTQAMTCLNPHIFVLGLGQGYLQWCTNSEDVNREIKRRDMIDSVMSIDGRLTNSDFQYHVLGARWSADSCDYSCFSQITGIDSIKPCTCAAAGLIYPERPQHRCVDRLSDLVVDENALMHNIEAFCEEYGCEG